MTASFPAAFDPADLGKVPLSDKLKALIFAKPRLLFWLLREFWPIFTWGNFALISRYADVKEAFGRQDVFGVPFGERMELLNGGPNFLLGMQDGPDYRRQREIAMRVFKITDIATIVRPAAKRLA